MNCATSGWNVRVEKLLVPFICQLLPNGHYKTVSPHTFIKLYSISERMLSSANLK